MSEAHGTGEHIRDPSRRKFLTRAGKLAVAGVGAAALGGMVSNEVVKAKEGINTPSGIFFPLYERHDTGIKVESIPHSLDVFFREDKFAGQTFSFAPEDILRQEFNSPFTEKVSAYPNKILAFLSQEKTEIMRGDVKTPGLSDYDGMIMIYETVAGAGLAAGRLSLQGKIDLKADIGRRKFLKVIMLAGAAWGLSKVPVFAGGILKEPSNKNAINRIFTRFAAIESHMHPELSSIFFRNIMMADKLLTVSEEIEERTGQKAKIAFQVGSAHAGIDDFLQAGHDFCRSLILVYPKWYLRSTIELNSGIKDFCSARLFKLPENLTEDDVASGEQLSLTTERRVVDEELERALTLKLASDPTL